MLYTELQPKLYNQKSYYKKAMIQDIDGKLNLYSYGVEMVNIKDGKIANLNSNPENYTQTTLKHVKDFLYQTLGIKGLTKKDILQLEKDLKYE